jgi:hypothetical protein
MKTFASDLGSLNTTSTRLSDEGETRREQLRAFDFVVHKRPHGSCTDPSHQCPLASPSSATPWECSRTSPADPRHAKLQFLHAYVLLVGDELVTRKERSLLSWRLASVQRQKYPTGQRCVCLSPRCIHARAGPVSMHHRCGYLILLVLVRLDLLALSIGNPRGPHQSRRPQTQPLQHPLACASSPLSPAHWCHPALSAQHVLTTASFRSMGESREGSPSCMPRWPRKCHHPSPIGH